MYERMHSLTDDELNKLHAASMELLRDVGVAFHEPEAVSIFKKHGIKVEGNTVFPGERDVARALETAPSRFTITARDPKKSVSIGEDRFVFAPGYGAPFIVTRTGEQRRGTLDDYNNFCKLVQTSRYIDMNGFLMVQPCDLPHETAHLDMLFSNIVMCDKAFMGSPTSRRAAADTIELAGIVWGGKEKLRDRAVMISVIGPTSPLQYSREMAGSLIEFARHGQPVIVPSLVMVGSSGPTTLAGVLALQNAEVLAGVVLAQLITPGLPVVYGSTSCPMDMRMGTLSVGAPEFSAIASASAQMARFYGLPGRGGGALTDALFPDIQAGIESTLALVTAVRNGMNFILHACGILGSYIAMSYEKFVIDEELCGMVRKLVEPIPISDETIDLEIIRDVGIGGGYLAHPKTLQQCRTAFFLPDLMNRRDYSAWKACGKKRLDEEAADVVAKRLATYEKPEIDPEIERALRRYVEKAKNK